MHCFTLTFLCGARALGVLGLFVTSVWASRWSVMRALGG